MARKMEVEVKVKLIINADDNVALQTVLDEMDYDFTDTTTQAVIEDTEILGYEVIDSK
jgi:flagellar assembly factor FliW